VSFALADSGDVVTGFVCMVMGCSPNPTNPRLLL
jgi:hypothetical protein